MTPNGSDAASPSAPPEDRRVVRVEIVISWVLRIGVVTSLAVVVVGLVLIFAHASGTAVLGRGTCRSSRSPAPSSRTPCRRSSRACCRLRGEAIVAVGLLLLILTPVARVAVSILAFLYQRDRVFTFITLTVLIILLMSFVIGRAE